jgi:hypothetical protein
LGIVLGFSFGGRDASETVHEALLIVPGDVIGGDVLDVTKGVELAASKRRVRPDALVFVEADGGLGQRIGVTDTTDRGAEA